MTALNSFIRILTGPKCLRSALRQKTVGVHRLMTELNSPNQMQVSIPVAVFGGDIFSVMSEQLREALVVPPPAGATVVNAHQRRSLWTPESTTSSFSKNLLPMAAQNKRSTLRSESLASSNLKQELAWDQTPPSRKSERSTLESQAPGLNSFLNNLLQQAAAASQLSVAELPASSSPKPAPATKPSSSAATLVNSLNRYWQSLREQHNSLRTNRAPISTDATNNPRDLAVPDFEQQPTSRAWPNFTARDSLKRTASFNDDSQRADQRSPKPARFDSVADPRNDFNLRTNPAADYAPHYDDLSDRLAEILHEQALQHGIDVT